MQYTVTQTIQSVRIDGNEPVDVQFYSGTDRAEAITAIAQASAVSDPEWVVLRSVRMDVTNPCPEEGCPLAVTTVHGLAPGGICPVHGHPEAQS